MIQYTTQPLSLSLLGKEKEGGRKREETRLNKRGKGKGERGRKKGKESKTMIYISNGGKKTMPHKQDQQ